MTRGTVLLLLALVASGAAPPGATVVGADSVSNGVASAAAAAAAQVQAQAQAQEQQPPPPQQQQQKPAAEMPVVEWGSDVGVEAQHERRSTRGRAAVLEAREVVRVGA